MSEHGNGNGELAAGFMGDGRGGEGRRREGRGGVVGEGSRYHYTIGYAFGVGVGLVWRCRDRDTDTDVLQIRGFLLRRSGHAMPYHAMPCLAVLTSDPAPSSKLNPLPSHLDNT